MVEKHKGKILVRPICKKVNNKKFKKFIQMKLYQPFAIDVIAVAAKQILYLPLVCLPIFMRIGQSRYYCADLVNKTYAYLNVSKTTFQNAMPADYMKVNNELHFKSGWSFGDPIHISI